MAHTGLKLLQQAIAHLSNLQMLGQDHAYHVEKDACVIKISSSISRVEPICMPYCPVQESPGGSGSGTPMPPAAPQGPVTLQVLREAFRNLLASKVEPKVASMSLSPSAAPMSPLHMLFDHMAPPPEMPPQVETATVTTVDTKVRKAGAAETGPEDVEMAAGAGGFGGLSPAFLSAMQDALEQAGYDLTSADIMDELSGDDFLPDALVSKLLAAAKATGVNDPLLLKEMVRQWQRAIEQQMELEKKLKQKKQRPVWRCAACGRYGCPVAPYIEFYQEVDDDG